MQFRQAQYSVKHLLFLHVEHCLIIAHKIQNLARSQGTASGTFPNTWQKKASHLLYSYNLLVVARPFTLYALFLSPVFWCEQATAWGREKEGGVCINELCKVYIHFDMEDVDESCPVQMSCFIWFPFCPSEKEADRKDMQKMWPGLKLKPGGGGAFPDSASQLASFACCKYTGGGI